MTIAVESGNSGGTGRAFGLEIWFNTLHAKYFCRANAAVSF